MKGVPAKPSKNQRVGRSERGRAALLFTHVLTGRLQHYQPTTRTPEPATPTQKAPRGAARQPPDVEKSPKFRPRLPSSSPQRDFAGARPCQARYAAPSASFGELNLVNWGGKAGEAGRPGGFWALQRSAEARARPGPPGSIRAWTGRGGPWRGPEGQRPQGSGTHGSAFFFRGAGPVGRCKGSGTR